MEFISNAYAQSAGAGPAGGFVSLLPMVLIFVLFYFLLIRPQQKRAKQHKEMVAALKEGDEVITAGGFFGTVMSVDETVASVQIAENTVVKVQRSSIAQMLPKGSV